MDSDLKPGKDEDADQDTEAPDLSSMPPVLVECGLQSLVTAGSSLQTAHTDPGRKEENPAGKRGFPESPDPGSAGLEEEQSAHVSKRMKLEEGMKLEEAEALKYDQQDASTSHHAAENTASEEKPPQEAVSLGVPSPLQEVSVSCTVDSVDPVFKCSTCGHMFTSCSDLDKHAACHLQLPQVHTCCHCDHQAESSPALHLHIQHAHESQQLFTCDLCGFQCVGESLWKAHYLGKTHLRRQNLAARGGFVQMLTKKSFPKKPCTLGTKNVRAKAKASKAIAKSRGPKGRQSSGSQCKAFRERTSKPSGGASELLVEMVPSMGFASEKGTILEESDGARNPENQSTALGTSATSESLLDMLETPRNALQSTHSVNMRPRPEQSVLTLGTSFRRRSGTFSTKGQAKKRFNLLGMNKRGPNETQRLYMKHFRTQVKTGDSKATTQQAELKSPVMSVCVSTSADPRQEVRQDQSSCQLPGSVQLDALAVKPAPGPHALWTCTDCGHIAMSRTDWEIHVGKCHARVRQLYCQMCSFSTASGRDLDEHLLSAHPQQPASVFTCQCCPVISLTDGSLQDHMKEKHSMGFRCAPCHLFFLTEKEAEEHKTTEQHLGTLVQPTPPQSGNTDLVLQTLPLSTLELANTDRSMKESGKAAQQEPQSRVSDGNEAKHSALSKPQFQCKKCFYKTRSSTVLTRHIKLRHGQDSHFLCKACNLYSLSKEGMEKHIRRSKHLENAKKNNIGFSFEECIERVCIGANDKKEEFGISGTGGSEGHAEGELLQEHSSLEKNTLTTGERSQSALVTKDNDLALTSAPKRGRPTGHMSRTCSHCGLLASSVTNLTVHIRRKHSHQYSYLCKVCKYYTVTKGDMERHRATKKHKARVQVETHGKQSADIIIGPEGGHLEGCRKTIKSAVVLPDEHAAQSAKSSTPVSERPAVDPGNPTEVEVDNVFHSVDGDVSSHLMDKKEQSSLNPEDLIQDRDACSPRDVTGASDNKCAHCEFNAHSSASLELHVKRKHTKEFEFYCMACDYYAVTRREMSRHATTEKHKMKRQSYLTCSSQEAAGSSETSKGVVITEEEQHQSAQEFQIIFNQSSDPLKSGNAPECSILDVSTDVDMSKVLCAPDSVEIEAEEESHFSEERPFCETFQQPLVKATTVKPEQVVSLNISATYGSPSKLQNENSGSPGLSCEIAKEKHTGPSEPCGPSAHADSTGGAVATDPPLSPEALPVVMHLTREQLALGSSEPSRAGGVPTAEGLQGTQEASVLESREVPVKPHQETKLLLEDGGLASDGTLDGSDTYETVISLDDKGQAVYSFGRFDSSIIRIKNSEDGELVEQSEEGLVASGVRISELPFKDSAPGAKKKKSEGSCFAESTRIRCDDCGFLADGLSGLNVHIAMKHPTKEKHFHCLLCGKSFYTESNLHQHLASAGHLRNEQASVEELPEGGATFKCVKCTEPFDSEQNLFLHIKGQHEELLREVNKYIVEDTEQINREREENQGNVCKYCGKMCRSSNSMAFLAHIRTHTGSKPFKCKICHFATAQLGDARNHVKRHLGMREYKCHVCGVAFVMKKHLNTHLLGKHGVGTPKERKFTCHLCDRSFTEKWALNNHMKLHTGEKPFKCSWPTCHYSFLTASAMKDHYRTHTGEKSFLCDLCGFAGGTRHALTKHRRQHTGEKPFRCEECSFASTTQSHLTRHKRVHTGEKPYSCPWCDYRSNCAENIRKHILHTGKHEGVKMYNCPKCDYGTNVPVEFRNHLKEQHPDIENPDLAYLHAGIVSKSYECRLKGQGAAFVETDSPFTAAALADEAAIKDKPLRSGRRPLPPAEQVQQVIIIQGYDGEFSLDASVEETAAATLQTLAMAGQVARVLHIGEDGQVIATSQGGTHVGSVLPGQLLPEQVVVVGGPMESSDVDEPLGAGGAILQQVAKQEMVTLTEAGIAPPDSSALDALLCAVSELGEVDARPGREEKSRCHRDALAQVPGSTGPEPPELPLCPAELGPVELLGQVVRPSGLLSPQERAPVAFKKVVQGVLQLTVCDPATTDQLVQEGVTQVIVHEEGAQVIMQEAGARGLRVPAEHMDLVESDGEISQIIVTEELVRAMVQESGSSFPEGATHYIVTELPPGLQDEAAVYSHTMIETAGSPEILQAGPPLNADASSPEGAGQLTSMVIYTQGASQAAATVIQSQREGSELQEA
ncbi:PREDICTED: zinc finger protein 407 [Chrysochloris asiatica]|uniref:Zinc finger protein 407 n=1 Tax=Chrysochloris asiatica TaxID=185453 RepID=A0A9B0X0E0_CHRAS|nr:PREDICTED: zinc finger protein 407 [Chrysochloris asiatica]